MEARRLRLVWAFLKCKVQSAKNSHYICKQLNTCDKWTQIKAVNKNPGNACSSVPSVCQSSSHQLAVHSPPLLFISAKFFSPSFTPQYKHWFFFPVIVPSSLLSCCLSVSSSTLQSCPWSAINVSGCLGVSEGTPLTQTLRRSRSVKQGSERFKKTGESKFLFQWDCLSCYSMVGGMLSHEGIWSNPAGIGRSVCNSSQAVT